MKEENRHEENEEVKEENSPYLTLEFDNGEVAQCEVVDLFNYKDKQYVLLHPTDGDDLYIYSYHEEKDGSITLNNMDKEEFEEVSAYYINKNKEKQQDNEAKKEDS